MTKKYNHVDVSIQAELKQVTNADGTRFYQTPTGLRYPSITTVLQNYGKDALIAWRKRVGEAEAKKISTSAARRGTKLHSIVEKFLKNEEPFDSNIDPMQKVLFNDLAPTLRDIDNIHCLEQKLYSHHLRLAGTVDCIAEHQGRLSVIDFKTSGRQKEKSWIENYFMQCAGYAVMYEELTGIPIDKVVVMIAVEGDQPQVFVEKRDNYINDLIYYRDLYEQTNPQPIRNSILR